MCSTFPGHATGKCSCKLAHLCKRRQQLEKAQRTETMIAIQPAAKLIMLSSPFLNDAGNTKTFYTSYRVLSREL
jgi:hypothetical protein